MSSARSGAARSRLDLPGRSLCSRPPHPAPGSRSSDRGARRRFASRCNFPRRHIVLDCRAAGYRPCTTTGYRRQIVTIVVTGATGNIGRPLVSYLLNAGAKVRAVSRNPQSAGLPAEVEVVESPTEAIPGASAVFLNSRALGGELAAVVDHARREELTRLVALSAINADDDFARQPSRFRGDRNKEVEQLAIDSGLPWVSLRPSVFVTNFVGMWCAQIRAGDVVRGPYAAASSSPIVESDIAEVAAHALLGDELLGRK